MSSCTKHYGDAGNEDGSKPLINLKVVIISSFAFPHFKLTRI